MILQTKKIATSLIVLTLITLPLVLWKYSRESTPASAPEIRTIEVDYRSTRVEIDKTVLEKEQPNKISILRVSTQNNKDTIAYKLAYDLGLSETKEPYIPKESLPKPTLHPETGNPIPPLLDEPFQASSNLLVKKEDNNTFYRWYGEESYFSYALETGTFHYKNIEKVSGNLDEQRVKTAVLDFLSNHNLLPEKYSVKINLPMVYVTPLVNGYPVTTDLNLNSETPIIFNVNPDLSFSEIYYSYVPPQEIKDVRTIKSLNTILEKVRNLKHNPTFIDIPRRLDNQRASPVITELAIDTAELSYYFSPYQQNADNLLFPVYVLKGRFNTPDRQGGYLTYMVPAI